MKKLWKDLVSTFNFGAYFILFPVYIVVGVMYKCVDFVFNKLQAYMEVCAKEVL